MNCTNLVILFCCSLSFSLSLKDGVGVGAGNTVQFPYPETCGVRKLGKTEGEAGAWYADSSCFMARGIGEQYQSQIHQPLQH
jgi:hypothetical protein